MTEKITAAVKQNAPLIHCITNPISINGCANVILCAGARPMMAEHPEEAAVMTSSAGALMLNMGNITDVRKTSMAISASTARMKGIPFMLDVCGSACLPTRRDYALGLIGTSLPSVIKGNYSEINALFDARYTSSGVDADKGLSEKDAANAAVQLAKRYGTVVLASGKTDIVTDGKRIALIANGCPQLSTITGTGCMQGALCAAYLSSADAFDAAVSACAVFGICGELAQTDKGAGSFYTGLLDALSTVTNKQITELAKISLSDV
ncbi:MAG: hydroxyethylthiazole kinase [Ruminococcus sp.]|nr:hydroxyethylthiazole kinase [Ruminococcus sp.]